MIRIAGLCRPYVQCLRKAIIGLSLVVASISYASAVSPSYPSFAPIVKQVSSGVVTIHTQRSAVTNVDPFFQSLFGLPQMQVRKEAALGSGVVYGKDGYIVTNNHVIANAQDISVTMQDRQQYKAKLIGSDPKSDIAVLQISGGDFVPIPLGDSDTIAVGDIVLAIGNPFGIGITVTSGIISAKERGGLGIEEYEDFLQTDAAINPGNSGGALLDTQGRLVGINTAIVSKSGGYNGVGFAIPSNQVKVVADQLIAHGKMQRGFIGVNLQDLTPELAKAFNVRHGVLVTAVAPNSPAAKAGIEEGDVIEKIGGVEITEARKLRTEIGHRAVNSVVRLAVRRQGELKVIDVTLEKGVDLDTTSLAGLELSEIHDAERQQFRLPNDLSGVLITGITSQAVQGLLVGDVITAINRVRVRSVADLNQHVRSQGNLLLVWRQGVLQYIVIP